MTGTDIQKLHREVERYLAAVEVFRREGCPPRWAPEGAVTGPQPEEVGHA